MSVYNFYQEGVCKKFCVQMIFYRLPRSNEQSGHSLRRLPHKSLHVVGESELAKVLANLATVFYTDKQMANVRRKTACLS